MNTILLESKFYRYEDSVLHYYKHGSGVKTLLCFHGFGQSASAFKSLAEQLASGYTIYSFDLFYHGDSHWPDCEKALTPECFSEMINAWLRSEQIHSISLCGYSMGGKIILSLIEFLDVPFEKLLLIAPDGIQTNFWYNMATYPHWARRLFKHTINRPFVFFRFVNFLGKAKVLDRSVIKFAKFQMNSVHKRKKVYCTWLTYRKIKPNVEKIANKLNESEIDLTIYLGKYDRVITEKRISPLIRKVKKYQLFILDKGHNTLIEDVAQEKTFNF